MKHLTIFFFLTLGALESFAQIDSLKMSFFSSSSGQDTLIVDIQNANCRVNNGDRFLIIKKEDRATIVQLKDFNLKMYFNGKEFKSNSEKQSFLLNNSDKLASSPVIVKTVERERLLDFFEELHKIISTENNVENIKIGGAYTTLTLVFKDFYFSKEYSNFISMQF